MKKFTSIVSVFFVFTILLFAAGCGQEKTEPVDIDMAKMSADIIACGAYTDSMGEAKAETACSLYGIDAADVADCAVYFSSMATAEECVIFKASNSAAAARLLTACKTRQSSQVTAYENYVPAEVSKINDAIIMQTGDYVMYIVSNDQAAVSTVLSSYGITVK